MQIKVVQVTIRVDGEPLEEFATSEDTAPRDVVDCTKTCYIASEAGKAFAIHLAHTGSEGADTFACRVRVDGMSTNSRIMRVGQSDGIAGVQISQTQLRPFMFSHIKLTDDDSAVRPSSDKLAELGTIQLSIHRVTEMGPGQPRTQFDEHQAFNTDTPMHEKTKKAGTHKVQLGEVIAYNGSRVNVDYIDKISDPPYFRLTFIYRPLDMLQAQGIAPLSQVGRRGSARPGPENASGSQPLDGSRDGSEVKTEEDLEEDVEALEALRAERAALDERIRQAEARRIKREPSPIVLNRPSGEVIDLTLD